MPASTLTAANPASVSPGASTYLAGYLAHDGGPGRIFITAANISNGGSGGLSNTCPAVTSLAQVTAVDGAFPDPQATPGTAVGGPWVMKLTPATTDTVNASSPMSRIYLSPNALMVTISS